MKYHFLLSLVFVITLGILVINEDINIRMMLIIPLLVLFYMTFIVFAVEYENHKKASWKVKKEKLVEDTYVRFFKEQKQKN